MTDEELDKEFCPRMTVREAAERFKQIEWRFASEDFPDAISMAVELFVDPKRDFSVRDFLLAITHSMPQLLHMHGQQWASGDLDGEAIDYEEMHDAHQMGAHTPSADGEEGPNPWCPECTTGKEN